MTWVTWENVGIDRMACAWLIRRQIDPAAEFAFIPAGSREIPDGATPFDIPGVPYSHRRGHCTFHTLLREFGLKDAILDRIAEIVDGADVPGNPGLAPESQGVDTICRGIGRTFPSDEARLKAAEMVFDAVYAQIEAETGQEVPGANLTDGPTTRGR